MINLHESMGPGRDQTRNPWNQLYQLAKVYLPGFEKDITHLSLASFFDPWSGAIEMKHIKQDFSFEAWVQSLGWT